MADVQVQQLPALGGNALAADDVLLAVDVSAVEARKITVNDLISAGSALIPNATIPSAKVSFAAGSILAAALATDAVTTEKLLADAVTGAKLADNSTCVVAANLVALQAVTGLFVGQLGLTTDNLKLYLWQGSAWQLIRAAGSVNAFAAGTTGIVNTTATISGDTATINTTIDPTTAAAQFLAGPTGAAGAVAYRTIAGTDLPTATTTTKGGVIINGGGLTMSGDTAVINNTVTPVTDLLQKITYNSQGLITASSAVGGTDLPAATNIARGAAQPGTGLTADVNGVFNHTNVVTGTTQNGITFDNQGHITNAVALVAGDIPNLDASKITTGTLNANLIGTNALSGTKLANFSTIKFGGAGSTSGVVTFPTPDFTGQGFFDSSNGDLYLFDGNTWQPITVISGDLVYAGTYNAATNRVKSVTTQGSAAGLVVGAVLPAASATNVRYYVVVSDSGTGVSPAPVAALAPPDMIVSNGATWDLVDVSNAIAGQTASNISFTPYGNLNASNVQTALQELDDEKLGVAGGTITGELRIAPAGSFCFEGSTDNAYETYLAVADPLSADRTITFPDASGTVVLSGTIVDADINASAAIADTKLATISTAGKVNGTALTGTIPSAVLGNSSTYVGTTIVALNRSSANQALTGISSLAMPGSTSGTITVTPAATAGTTAITVPATSGTLITSGDSGTVTSTMIADGTIVNGDINASAAIADTKLATISTAGKVSNSATTATSANTANTIVARDASGNFIAGAITATSFSGSGVSLTSLTAGNLTGTIPTGVLGNSSLFVGTTSVALNRASANQALTGISSIALPGATSGTITVTPAATAGTTAITVPATSGTLVTTGDTGTVTSTMIADGTIVNADISATAEIAVSKLADGNARQLLQTAANGTDVEWTDNVDIPGTLDVTGIGTFDAATRGAISALGAVSAGTTTLNFATANHFSLSLPAGGTVTLANPSNLTAGQSGCVVITQNGTTAATVAYGTAWKFQGGAPSVSTTLSSVNVIAYFVESASRITAQLLPNTIS